MLRNISQKYAVGYVKSTIQGVWSEEALIGPVTDHLLASGHFGKEQWEPSPVPAPEALPVVPPHRQFVGVLNGFSDRDFTRELLIDVQYGARDAAGQVYSNRIIVPSLALIATPTLRYQMIDRKALLALEEEIRESVARTLFQEIVEKMPEEKRGAASFASVRQKMLKRVTNALERIEKAPTGWSRLNAKLLDIGMHRLRIPSSDGRESPSEAAIDTDDLANIIEDAVLTDFRNDPTTAKELMKISREIGVE